MSGRAGPLSQAELRLLTELRRLWAGAGNPGFRAIARDLGTVSHTTVADVFNGKRLASWNVVSDIVVHLGGAPADVRQLWTEASAAKDEAARGSRRPAAEGPRRDGARPVARRFPPPVPHFVGRDGLLADLHRSFHAAEAATIQVLHGIGGVGKTQLAIEYATRFAHEYDLVWWVDAERESAVPGQLAELATAAGWAAGADDPIAVDRVMQELCRRRRWLLIFDDPQDVVGLARWLPSGPGHVLLTARSRSFLTIARPWAVDVFSRSESVECLRLSNPSIGETDADGLAGDLGDLPLALAQAAGVLAATGMGVGEYRGELAVRADALLAQPAGGYGAKALTATVGIAMDALAAVTAPENTAATALVEFLSVLGAGPLSLSWFSSMPDQLQHLVTNRTLLRLGLGRLSGFGLANLDEDTVEVHRLVQSIVTARRPAERVAADRQAAEEFLLAAARGLDADRSEDWPRWKQLLPHLRTATTLESDDAELRRTYCRAMWYLIVADRPHVAQSLAETCHEQWTRRYGEDDEDVLWSGAMLAHAYRLTGRLGEARGLGERVLLRRRLTGGDAGTYTLTAANGLASTLRRLGEYEHARALDVETLRHRTRLFGDDDLETMRSATNYALDLAGLGRWTEAGDIHRETWGRRRETLGDDHFDTLSSAVYLADCLRRAGEVARARSIAEETYERLARTVGEDHWRTAAAASALADALAALGELSAAEEVRRRVYDLRVRKLPAHDRSSLLARAELAETWFRAGRRAESRAVAADVLADFRAHWGVHDPDTVRVAALLRDVLAEDP